MNRILKAVQNTMLQMMGVGLLIMASVSLYVFAYRSPILTIFIGSFLLAFNYMLLRGEK